MKKAGDTKYSHNSLEGYISASVVTYGLKNAGSPVSRERFISALEAKRIDLGGFELNFANGARNGSRFTDLVIVGSNGQFIR
jgi:ABC-type branched-subunit amino acid transport system substrate-binding protein